MQGDLKGACSRRINIRHRLIYEVLQDTVKIISMDALRIVRFSAVRLVMKQPLQKTKLKYISFNSQITAKR
ncbi:MAG: type II toxin-antitoxin system YoeB family toxin [Campylobacteraceae bacterium]|nr:type II toxin-antitoxin system YoeB family toxin [Campylobacteraceae bacterium]